MNIRIKKYYNISSVKKEWQELYNKNPQLTPFQDYDYVKKLFQTKLLSLRRGLCPVFYVFFKGKNSNYEPIVIAPLLKPIFNQTQNSYTILGAQDCDITDFLYSKDLDLEDMIFCIRALQKDVDRPIKIVRVLENSLLIKAIQKIYPNEEIQKEILVKIPPQRDIDEYIAGLSKSTRQNIRTTYNRMNRDEIKFELEVAYPNKENALLFAEAMDNYIDRQIEYGFPILAGKKWLTKLYFKHIHSETLCLKSLRNSFTSVLRFNGEIAGTIMGYVYDFEKSIIIPRLAINTKFNFYSPGSILIIETMRYLLNKTNLNVIDLAAGNEIYKYKMGGIEYFTCDVILPRI